jgi:hypothetical protein
MNDYLRLYVAKQSLDIGAANQIVLAMLRDEHIIAAAFAQAVYNALAEKAAAAGDADSFVFKWILHSFKRTGREPLPPEDCQGSQVWRGAFAPCPEYWRLNR